MKNFFAIVFAIGSILNHARGSDSSLVKPLYGGTVQLFSLADIRLLDSEFKHIMDLDHQYLLSLEPDRILSWFRREAGLLPKALPYPYWESEDVWGKGPLAGHILGFYLSSMSMMYQSTGDTAIISKLDYVLHELDRCQRAGKDGYLLATINGRHVFEDVVAKKFTTSNPLINDSWEPVYIMNKIMLGLHGVYTRCNAPLAREIFVKMADWFGDSVLKKLSHDDIQKLLVCEHGSINESYINAYAVTGNKKYLEWAKQLNDEDMWVPLSQGRDILNGWHANTQIPKFTGFENVYNYTGDKRFTDAADFFWNIVVNKHTWAMGGNSTGEHFFALKEFENKVPMLGGPESCNSVNMLRLTEILYSDYADVRKIDYYERVLYNHILANYDPEKGMCVYYTSMRPGHYKIYGSPFSSFWCCTGTGMESPAKFGRMIYAHDSTDLYVNLFIPSRVIWKEKQLALTQQTSFPDDGETVFTVQLDAPSAFGIKIRHPQWLLSKSLSVKINGKLFNTAQSPGGYDEIKRTWKNGDKISIILNCKMNVKPLVGSDKYLSVLYGPIVLAAEIDNHGLQKQDFFSERNTVAQKKIPLSAAPAFFGTYAVIRSNTVKDNSRQLLFTANNKVAGAPVRLVPFYRIHFNRYALYFRHYESRVAFDTAARNEYASENLQHKIDSAATDVVIAGDTTSEKLHLMETVSSFSGGAGSSTWRRIRNGGYIIYRLKVPAGSRPALCLQFADFADRTGVFDVLADGKLVQTIDQTSPVLGQNGEQYSQFIYLPASANEQPFITVKIQAHNKSGTGNLLAIRLMGADFEKEISP